MSEITENLQAELEVWLEVLAGIEQEISQILTDVAAKEELKDALQDKENIQLSIQELEVEILNSLSLEERLNKQVDPMLAKQLTLFRERTVT